MMSTFDPTREDQNIVSLTDALNFADKIIKFAAFLRNVDQSKVNIEIDRFFQDGYIGPITLTARNVSPRLQQVWQYNSLALYDILEKNANISAIVLMLLLNECYLPADNNIPSYYRVCDITFENKSARIGLVDRQIFANDIEIESILVDGKITKSEKQAYHLDDEFSVYEIEYSYSWGSRSYSAADLVLLNTSHLGWANHGGLLNFPTIDLTEKDLDKMLASGTEIKVYVAKDNGFIRNPVYDDFVYEVGKM